MISKTITSFSIALLLFFVTLSASISVQGQTTTRYVYDENGRLHAVIAPSGEAARYRYDAAGNITEVERIEANVTTNLDFTPKVGAQTDLVEIVGTGFSPTPNANLVTFTGVTAQVREASLTRLVVEVPFGATTGPINVIAPNGASQSAVPFTIMPRLKMTPANVILPVSTEQQFTATPLSVDGNTAVTWMVNGVIGGNATVGTISTTGAYLSPPTPRTGIVIRALITAQPEIYGEAQVQVSTIGRFAYTALLVQRGESSPAAVFASQVTVRYGEDIGAVQSP